MTEDANGKTPTEDVPASEPTTTDDTGGRTGTREACYTASGDTRLSGTRKSDLLETSAESPEPPRPSTRVRKPPDR